MAQRCLGLPAHKTGDGGGVSGSGVAVSDGFVVRRNGQGRLVDRKHLASGDLTHVVVCGIRRFYDKGAQFKCVRTGVKAVCATKLTGKEGITRDDVVIVLTAADRICKDRIIIFAVRLALTVYGSDGKRSVHDQRLVDRSAVRNVVAACTSEVVTDLMLPRVSDLGHAGDGKRSPIAPSFVDVGTVFIRLRNSLRNQGVLADQAILHAREGYCKRISVRVHGFQARDRRGQFLRRHRDLDAARHVVVVGRRDLVIKRTHVRNVFVGDLVKRHVAAAVGLGVQIGDGLPMDRRNLRVNVRGLRHAAVGHRAALIYGGDRQRSGGDDPRINGGAHAVRNGIGVGAGCLLDQNVVDLVVIGKTEGNGKARRRDLCVIAVDPGDNQVARFAADRAELDGTRGYLLGITGINERLRI